MVTNGFLSEPVAWQIVTLCELSPEGGVARAGLVATPAAMNPQAPSVSSAVAPFFLIVDVSGMLAASFRFGHSGARVRRNIGPGDSGALAAPECQEDDFAVGIL